MSTIDFPNDPQVDDEYSFGTRTWKWTGEAWQLIASGLTGPTGPTGPAGPEAEYFTLTVETVDWDPYEDDPYIAILSVPGILATDRPTVSLDTFDAEYGLDLAVLLEAWQTVYQIEASDDDEITLYASSLPTKDFPVLLQVVR
jgi:hypothetical protein